jgi:formylglycine-generating enzyme required for sulfatase activity
MKQNYKLYLAALLLVGATGMMTAGAQTTPTLAVFVVGDNTISSSLTTALGANLTSGGRYTLTSANTGSKLTELQATYAAGGGSSSIDRNALAAWGRTNNISAICLVVDDKKGNDHLFSARLINAKDSKVSGKGNYVRANVAAGDVMRIALALSKQLEGPERRRSTPAPARSYPAELDIEMVHVEGGTFTMGCTTEQEQTGYCLDESEKPVHNVTLRSFYIGKYEVTQAQWVAVMGSNPSNDKTDDQQPVEFITWLEALEFCNMLSEQVGLTPAYAIDGTTVTLNSTYTGYRLPTEAEWEYAARGCNAGNCENLVYSGSNNADEVGWRGRISHPVGEKKPNRLMIYDMSGNVCELCFDISKLYLSGNQTNPLNAGGWSFGGTDIYRIIRGCAMGYSDMTDFLRISARALWFSYNASRAVDVGFRVVLPAQ